MQPYAQTCRTKEYAILRQEHIMRVVVTAALIMHSCFGAMQIVSYEEASLFTQLAIQLASLYLHNSKSNLHHKQVGVWLHYNRCMARTLPCTVITSHHWAVLFTCPFLRACMDDRADSSSILHIWTSYYNGHHCMPLVFCCHCLIETNCNF